MTTVLKAFARQLIVGFAVLVALTVVLGLAYPAGVWVVSRIGATSAEGGQLTDAHGCDVGSALIGVDPKPAAGQPDWYLHTRVAGTSADTAADAMAPGDPASSGPSNLGPNNPDLKKLIDVRRTYIAARDGVPAQEVPADAVTGSGSGLDPDISVAYAQLQIARISRNSGLPTTKVRQIIDDNTAGRQWGFLGQARVNVADVNLALGHTVGVCRS
ncbi:potassium-transporting ATPase subunit C [Gordonia sp. TBRC 11910]|uniref:Potassium-transporting ATPase KdpC subunit n=1 Tax=Gordonia asplenii TaxID=2725283 RepID=A0A848L0Y9_9ACTN|nr:potassium-transporting ATPase subunit C [Gordonia asplenii]NMO04132.1 potassium-transporting ATPase subunit C [Gordonia asplenii]